MVGNLGMSVYTAYVRCPRCGTPQHTWIKEGKFLPHNATLCENCDAIYPADETLFQILLANSVSSSRSLLNANV